MDCAAALGNAVGLIFLGSMFGAAIGVLLHSIYTDHMHRRYDRPCPNCTEPEEKP